MTWYEQLINDSQALLVFGPILIAILIVARIYKQRETKRRTDLEENFDKKTNFKRNEDLFIPEKDVDFFFREKKRLKGVFVIKNETTKKYYIGGDNDIIHKVWALMKSDEIPQIKKGKEEGDRFSIRLIGLESSGFKNNKELSDYCKSIYQKSKEN